MHTVKPVILNYVFRYVKIANNVGSMSFAVVFSQVQVCVVRLVLEFRAKMIKIANQGNIVLERITQFAPQRALCQRVTQMMIAPLDNVVATTGIVQLGHAA